MTLKRMLIASVLFMIIIGLGACQLISPIELELEYESEPEPAMMSPTVHRTNLILEDFDRYLEVLYYDADAQVIEEAADRVTSILRGTFATDWLWALESMYTNGQDIDELISLIGYRVAAARRAKDDTYEQALTDAANDYTTPVQAQILQRIYERIEYFYIEAYEETEIIPWSIFAREPLPKHIIEFIRQYSFGGNPAGEPPFSYDFLTYLTITHMNFEGGHQIGHMIVADEIGDEALDIFRDIYESGFPIHSIRLIDYFYADDILSLEANNSSAFNFRYIAGTDRISRHGLGMAIDINPIQNPYIRGDNIKPYTGQAYLDRSDVRPGMIVSGDAVYTAFISRGWIWGGNWSVPRDYHHFERR